MQNVNYIIKGLRRLFEEDMAKQSALFVEVYVSLYKFLETIDHIYINSIFDEFLLLFTRYYLQYVPFIKKWGLIPFKDLDKVLIDVDTGVDRSPYLN